MNTRYSLIFFLFFYHLNYFAQEKVLYKKIDTTQLFITIYAPEKIDAVKKYPALVFFFGGGWNEGTIKKFEPQAKYFAKRGLVCFLVDYRVKNRQQTTPFESLKDAKSAMRYIREHADKFHIDPLKMAAAGESAGGHLAAATAVIKAYNEPSDNLSISCVPNALILFNPVIDNGPGGYGFQRIGDQYKSFSPLHNIEKGAPPTLLFLGTEDLYIPVETVKYYQMVMKKVGSRCDLHLYQGMKHSFFNSKQNNAYQDTLGKSDLFLQSLGYLQSEPKVDME